jgi:hypothetical protein
MAEAHTRVVVIHLVKRLAADWRAEFGADVDAHPGGPGSEAGQLNRAYRATARCLCREIAGPETSGLATEALALSAAKRLAATGLRGASAESLLNFEPQLGDAWAAYLALAPWTVIRDLLEPDPSDLS